MSDSTEVAIVTALITAAATAIPIVISDVLKTWLAWHNLKAAQEKVLTVAQAAVDEAGAATKEAEKSSILTEHNISQTTRIGELVNGKTEALKAEIEALKKKLDEKK